MEYDYVEVDSNVQKPYQNEIFSPLKILSWLYFVDYLLPTSIIMTPHHLKITGIAFNKKNLWASLDEPFEYWQYINNPHLLYLFIKSQVKIDCNN